MVEDLVGVFIKHLTAVDEMLMLMFSPLRLSHFSILHVKLFEAREPHVEKHAERFGNERFIFIFGPYLYNVRDNLTPTLPCNAVLGDLELDNGE